MTGRSTLKTTLWSIVASGATAAAGLVSGVLVARTLGPSARGEFAAVVSWAGVMMMFSNLGIGYAISYYAGREPERVDTLYSQAIAVTALFGAAAWLFGGVLIRLVPAVSTLSAATTWIGLSAIMAGGLSGVVVSLFLGTGRIRAVNVIGMGTAWTYTAGVLALWVAGDRQVASYVYVHAAALAAVCLATYWIGRRIGKFQWRWSTAGLREVVGYGLKSQVASLVAHANLRLDQFMMSMLVQPEQLGYYVVAVALGSMTSPLYSGINVVLTPRVTGAASPRAGALWGLRMALLALALGGLGSLVLAIASPLIIPLLFGGRFERSIGMARVLLAAAVFQGTNLLLGSTLRGLGRPTAQGKAEASGAVATLALLMLLLPALGGMGAAVASLASYALVSLIETVMVFRAGSLRFADVATDLGEVFRGLWSLHAREQE